VKVLINKKWFFVSTCILLFLAAGCSSSGSSSGGSSKSGTWKIGALYPLSGNLAVLGNEALTGAEIALEMANEKGGFDGKKFELVKTDVTDPQKATTEARRLVKQENAQMLIGTYGSSIMLANAAVADQNKVIYWEGGAVSDDLVKQGYKYAFRTNDNTSAMATAMIDGIPDLAGKTLNKPVQELNVALVYEDSAFGKAIASVAQSRAKEKGVNISFVESYSASNSDYSSLVLKLQNKKPDVLLLSQYFNDAILFWKQARENNFNPKIVIASGTGQTTPDFYKGVGSDADGILVADVSSEINQSTLTEEAKNMLTEFNKRYKEKTGKNPASHSIRNFISMHTLFEKVIPKAGSLDADKIRQAALSLDEPLGSTPLAFGIKFGEDGQNERIFNTIQQWQKGELITVWPKEYAKKDPISLPLPEWKDRK
jgi:branched-chain amino acid transport system substrate-binding protein